MKPKYSDGENIINENRNDVLQLLIGLVSQTFGPLMNKIWEHLSKLQMRIVY